MATESARPAIGRSPVRQQGRWLLQGLALLAFWGLCKLLPPAHASRFGSGLLERLGPRSAKHRHVLRNLRVAFPELPEDGIAALARQVWGTLGSVLAEYPHLGRLLRSGADDHLDVVTDGAASALQSGAPAIFASAHVGNWELAAGTVCLRLGLPLHGVYGPQENPLADRMVQRFRKALGCGMVAKENSLRELVRALREGRSIGFVVDQRVDGSPLVPFFGVPAATAISPAWLAIRFGCPLLPVRVERLPGARFRVTIGPPLPVPEQGSDEERALEMTRALNERFEAWIRERPGQWMCTKRRWSKREVRKVCGKPRVPSAKAAPGAD